MPIHFRDTPVKEPFTFESIGDRWEQDSVMRPGGYPVYHYMQTEKGRGSVYVQNKKYVLEEDEGILIAPFIRHSYARDTSEWITAFATFTGTIDGSIAKMAGNRQVIFIEKEQGRQIGDMIHEIMEQWDQLSAYPCALSVRCYCLLMNLANSIYTQNSAKNPLYMRYVEPVIREIETHYDSELTVQELSDKVYVTPQYLTRLFRRFLGYSVYEYLTVYRINRAREILVLNPQTEIRQVAGQIGFADTSHFISIFKKMTGLTPLEFRKMN